MRQRGRGRDRGRPKCAHEREKKSVRVRESEREGDTECVRMRERKRECVSVHVSVKECACVYMREGVWERESACVCVYVRVCMCESPHSALWRLTHTTHAQCPSPPRSPICLLTSPTALASETTTWKVDQAGSEATFSRTKARRAAPSEYRNSAQAPQRHGAQ